MYTFIFSLREARLDKQATVAADVLRVLAYIIALLVLAFMASAWYHDNFV